MTDPDPLVIALNRRRREAKVRVGTLMLRAGLHPTTWSGWQAGVLPKLSNLRAAEAALDAIVAERETA